MRNEFLPFYPPHLGEEEIQEVVDTLRSHWITTGPKTKKFEEEFQAHVGSDGALALSSCTAALHLALKCLDIGPGDEVITTPMTFAATVNVIEHVGATPVLVDVEPRTLNIDANQIEAAITSRTRAIIPVHYAGHSVDLAAINDIADRHGLRVIEDAAHAIGASYRGVPIGGHNNLTAYSFYATKNLTTAEGGMLTGPKELLDRARVLGLHGMSRDAWKRFSQAGSWFYEIHEPGFKYNMTDVQASIGIWQLRKFAAAQQRRADVYSAYNTAFSENAEFELPTQRDDVEHAWHLYVLRLNLEHLSIDRNAFIEELKERNIGTSVHFIPIHTHPYYRKKYGWQPEDFPRAWSNYQRLLSLPLHPWLQPEEITDVITAVQGYRMDSPPSRCRLAAKFNSRDPKKRPCFGTSCRHAV